MIKLGKIRLTILSIGLFMSGMFLTNRSLGQMPSSPSGLALSRSVNVPVNMYTGIPQISIPLVSIPHQNGHNVAVGISYHAGGIKVQDVAGPVGLGWSLQAGGMITRVVNGLPDEDGNFFNGSDPDFVADIADGLVDGEHDDFYFTMAGRSGKFQMSKNGATMYTIPYNDMIKISKQGFDVNNCSWIITDELGNSYYFGTTSALRESTSTNSMDNFEQYDPANEKTFTSTWYLEKIKYSDSDVEVGFTYTPGVDYQYEYFSGIASNSPSSSNPELYTSFSRTDTRIKIISPKYLAKIATSYGEIRFQWNADRKDIAMKYLSGVSLHDYNGMEIVSHTLDHSYFDSSDSYYWGEPFIDQNNSNVCTDALCKRLRLNNLTQKIGAKSYLTHEFSYNDTNLGTEGGNAYSLPRRDMGQEDHWGFFTSVKSLYDRGLPIALGGQYRQYKPVLKNSAIDYTLACSLKEILNPTTGTFTRFNLESNSPGGGLRVESIESGIRNLVSGLESEVKTESYSYGTPTGANIPNYETVFTYQGTEYRHVMSRSSIALFDKNGVSVGYSTIEKTNIDGTKEVFDFIDSSEQPDDLAVREFSGGGTFPTVVPNTSRASRRGMIEKHEIIKDQDPGFSHIKSNTFISYPLADNSDPFGGVEYPGTPINITPEGIWNVVAFDMGWNRGTRIIKPFSYYSESKTVGLFKSQQTIMEDNVASVRRQEYNYSPTNWARVTSYLDFLPDNTVYKTEYLYSDDLCTSTASPATSEAFAYCTMKSKNMIGIPVSTVVLSTPSGSSDTKVISSSIQTYKKEGTNLILPYKSYSLEIDEPISLSSLEQPWINYAPSTKTLEFDDRYENKATLRYTSNGNLWYEIGADGIRTDYTWGYNNTLVTQKSSEGFTTSYEHIPLVGVSKVTDPNGKETTYEYDELNRLRVVRDDDNNIVKRYRYNLAGQDADDLSAQLIISGKNKTNLSLTFKSEFAISAYGKTRHIWDFGDGTVTETEAPEITHSYSSAGAYQVKLTLLNPEYEEPLQVAKPLSIYNQDLTVTICRRSASYNACVGMYELGDDDCTFPNGIGSFMINQEPGARCLGSLSYQWQIRNSNSSAWSNFGGNSPISTFEGSLTTVNSYVIRCTVRDICNTSYNAPLETTFSVVRPNNCSTNGGGGEF